MSTEPPNEYKDEYAYSPGSWFIADGVVYFVEARTWIFDVEYPDHQDGFAGASDQRQYILQIAASERDDEGSTIVVSEHGVAAHARSVSHSEAHSHAEAISDTHLIPDP